MKKAQGWLPIAISAASAIFAAGATWATVGLRVSVTEAKILEIQAEQKAAREHLERYERQSDVMATDIRWIRQALEKSKE